MTFHFSRHGLTDPKEKRLQRFFEILPGAASWFILLSMLLLSFWKPLLAAVFIIAFNLYWILRLFYLTLFLLISYFRLSIEQRTDWMKRLQELGLSSNLYHLVIIPVVKESRQIFEPGIASLAHGKFPTRQIIVILAVEERAPKEIHQDACDTAQAYRSVFSDFLVVIHPDGIPGEARVKGANIAHAAKEGEKFLRTKGIPLNEVVVSCFDADTVVSPDYFSCLTYTFLTCPQRHRASFQPIPVYHNNVWEAHGFARVLETGSSFFQMIEATNPEKLVTFSSHSMSLKALTEVGFWPVDMVSDDSAIFWKAFLHFEGDYRVVPMYVTLSMDVVDAGSWWKTTVMVYRQKRRWAWGVENFPIVMRGLLKSKKISLYDKIRHGFKLFEGHVSWATSAFLVTFIGWLPALFAGQDFSNSVLYYTAPRITAIIFNLASLSLLTSIVLSLWLLPKKKVRFPFLKRVGFACEWLFVPLIATFLSALPALDAQTRLMLGKHLGFWVTEKKRGKTEARHIYSERALL